MDSLVKNSIDSRKQAFYSAYEIKDESLIEKVEDLFRRIEEFGESCQDATDFETRFASSSLNQEYIQLFTEIATTCPPIAHDTPINATVKSTGEQVLDEIKDEMEYQVKDATLPMRRIARQQAYDKARSTPIVGDVMEIKQHIDFFSRFKNLKKKKDKNKEKEDKE